MYKKHQKAYYHISAPGLKSPIVGKKKATDFSEDFKAVWISWNAEDEKMMVYM